LQAPDSFKRRSADKKATIPTKRPPVFLKGVKSRQLVNRNTTTPNMSDQSQHHSPKQIWSIATPRPKIDLIGRNTMIQSRCKKCKQTETSRLRHIRPSMSGLGCLTVGRAACSHTQARASPPSRTPLWDLYSVCLPPGIA
jgi:hypothetical protein